MEPPLKKPRSAVAKINVCLVGAGRIGKVHYQNIVSNAKFRLLYVVDVVAATAKSLAEAAGATPLSDLAEALADPELQAIVVCAPTAQHHKIIVAAAAAKKHIMCEKPISLELAELDLCYQAAKQHGVHLLCGYQRRHDPNFSTLVKHVHDGGIGVPQVIRSCSRDNPVPTLAYLKISGGIMHDCGMPAFICYLFHKN